MPKHKHTPSMAKNHIKRCLRGLLDPYPSGDDLDLIWDYFLSACAYCGKTIDRKSRLGHLDHAVSASNGGGNNIYCHVLACSICNGDEKREESWDRFLAIKCASDEKSFVLRREKIEGWLSLGTKILTNNQKRAEVEAIISDALKVLSDSVVVLISAN